MILSESVLLTLSGAAIGSASGVALAQSLGRFHTTAGLIAGRVAPIVILQGFLLALAIGFFGAAYPAWWSASLRPVDALRQK
jgi:ABC-type antimicrobial peptide transport system permease subunit